MHLPSIRYPQKVCLAAFFWVTMGFVTASAQDDRPLLEDDYLTGDVPEWLEDVGFDDTHGNAPAAEGSSVPMEGASDGEATGVPTAAKQKCNCLRCRDKLTGDWHGLRTILKEEGIGYRGRVTQFFFGVGGGVNPPVPDQFANLGIGGGDTFEYTGNSRHDFLFDMDKFGGLPHSKFLLTMENLWGRWGNVSFETGGLAPAVFKYVMPVEHAASGNLYCTNFMLVQPLSEKFILSAGKTRTIGIADNNKFAGGDGSDQFLNQSFVANPLMVPMIPLSTFVVAAAMPQDWGHVGVSLMDTIERSTDFMDFGTLFSQGAIIFSQVQVDTNFFGLPGEHHVGGFYKNADQIDLTFTPLPPTYPYAPAPPAFQSRSESYTLFYGFDQYLVTYGGPDKRGNSEGWGFFGRASIADDARGNPNWAAWFVSLGIGGNSPLASRRGKGDRFGVGFGYTGASSEFGAIPRFLFAPRDAQNIEMYYRYHITPAIEFTPDVQWVNGILGGLTGGDGAIVAGIRLNMKI
ncbi:MAG: carbohydrate porin [Planctomycetota bacterium]